MRLTCLFDEVYTSQCRFDILLVTLFLIFIFYLLIKYKKYIWAWLTNAPEIREGW